MTLCSSGSIAPSRDRAAKGEGAGLHPEHSQVGGGRNDVSGSGMVGRPVGGPIRVLGKGAVDQALVDAGQRIHEPKT